MIPDSDYALSHSCRSACCHEGGSDSCPCPLLQRLDGHKLSYAGRALHNVEGGKHSLTHLLATAVKETAPLPLKEAAIIIDTLLQLSVRGLRRGSVLSKI